MSFKSELLRFLCGELVSVGIPSWEKQAGSSAAAVVDVDGPAEVGVLDCTVVVGTLCFAVSSRLLLLVSRKTRPPRLYNDGEISAP